MIRWSFAALHLLALGIGLGAVWARSRILRGPLDAAGLRRAFHADNWWGVAAVVWIVTGLARAFGGLEKGAGYYLHNDLFWLKMAVLGAVLALEAWPMATLVRWRIRSRRGHAIDASPAPALARISAVQAGLVVLMVLAAAAMARGYGASGG